MTTRMLLTALLAAGMLLATGSASHADLIGYWPLDESSGTNAPNLGSGAGGPTNGTLVNMEDADWVAGQFGNALAFDGNDEYVDAGDIPAIGTTDDFTWSLWTYNEDVVNNDVILGNRDDGGANVGWTKFTTSKFEYRSNQNADIDYSDIPQNQWVHHAVVKSGATMTYYRNGVDSGLTSTSTAAATAQPFNLGGDAPFNEHWHGRLDDVAVWTDALPANTIAGLANGTISPPGALIPEPSTLVLAILSLLGFAILRRRRRK